MNCKTQTLSTFKKQIVAVLASSNCFLLEFFRYEMRFNMKTGLASQKKLSASAVDFPRVNESYTGRYVD